MQKCPQNQVFVLFLYALTTDADMKRLFLPLVMAALFFNVAQAQSLRLDFETRGGIMFDSNPHFYADFLSLNLRTDIAKGLSFTWKQRFNKSFTGPQPLNATDYVYLDYKAGDWTFSAGKQVLECGGFEYDAPPIDLHFTTEYFTAINCYQFGVSVSKTFGNYRLVGQFCRSPYATLDTPESNSLKAFNLALHGTYGVGGWIPMYSLNLFEAAPGAYSFQFTLGNRFEIMKSLAFELDFLNRSAPGSVSLFKDMSAVAYVSIIPVEWCEIMLKGVYDRNVLWDDPLIQKGCSKWKAGIGVYFFPLKENKVIRLHCYYWHQPEGDFVQTGLTWRPTVLNLDFSKK